MPYDESEIERLRKQEERRPRKGRQGATDVETRRKRLAERLEIQVIVRRFAKERDWQGFQNLLTEKFPGIKPGSDQYRVVSREFWNVVAELDEPKRGSP